MSRRTVQDVLVAAGEACANAIEHGHRDAPGQPIRLPGRGHGHPAPADRHRQRPLAAGPAGADPLRGHGIGLMRALMQQVSIDRGRTGTTVDMEMTISP